MFSLLQRQFRPFVFVFRFIGYSRSCSRSSLDSRNIEVFDISCSKKLLSQSLPLFNPPSFPFIVISLSLSLSLSLYLTIYQPSLSLSLHLSISIHLFLSLSLLNIECLIEEARNQQILVEPSQTQLGLALGPLRPISNDCWTVIP